MADEVLTTSGREPSVATDQAAGLGAITVSTTPLAVDASVLQLYVGGLSGSQGAPGVQNDYPRSVQYVHIGVNSGSYTVTITGTTVDGETDTEEISVVDAGTFRGVKAWAWITDVDLGAGIDALDSAQFQADSKIGIPYGIYATADVLHVVKNATAMQPASFTINTTYNTIEETGVPVGALDEYWYWVRWHGAI